MANHRSAEKRIRQTLKRTQRNKHIRATVRGCIKRVRAAIGERDAEGANAALALAARHIDRAVSKGVYHRKTGSRYIARLSGQVARLG